MMNVKNCSPYPYQGIKPGSPKNFHGMGVWKFTYILKKGEIQALEMVQRSFLRKISGMHNLSY